MRFTRSVGLCRAFLIGKEDGVVPNLKPGVVQRAALLRDGGRV